MSLVELLLATGLLLGSSAASLGVWSQVSATLMEHREELVHLESLEAEIQAVEARLRHSHLDPFGPQRSCEEQLQHLVARLENQPPRAGVVRTLELSSGAEILLIRLRAGDQERRRLYSPSAFGGCGGDPAAIPAVAPAQALAEGGGNGAL
jgi:hypothetical protein